MAQYIDFKPKDYFNTILYTGTGSSQAITGVGFKPDCVWNKSRSNDYSHALTDSIRGIKWILFPDTTSASTEYANGLTSFDSDGFTAGSDNLWGSSSVTYVTWNWKAESTSVPSGGSITPATVRLNATSGIFMCEFTGNGVSGATIAHGLGKAPAMIMVKQANTTDNWQIYHQELGPTKYQVLNEGYVNATDSSKWNDTAPTSTLFSLGNAGDTNESGGTFMAYAFAEIPGYSKFGSYQGSGNASYPAFVYTGFRPAMVLIKTSSATNWTMHDDKRPAYVGTGSRVCPDIFQAEHNNATYARVDKHSNGFVPGFTTESLINSTSNSYMYAAFAAEPLVGASKNPGLAN